MIAGLPLANGDGLPLLERVSKDLRRARLLVLAPGADPFIVQRLREIGVHGFVEKEQGLEIFEEAVVE